MILRLHRFSEAPGRRYRQAWSGCSCADAGIRIRAASLLLMMAVASTSFADSGLPRGESTGEAGFKGASGFYDDPDADYADDGSRTVKAGPADSSSETLTPLSPLEEQGLLGDWGDSVDEAED